MNIYKHSFQEKKDFTYMEDYSFFMTSLTRKKILKSLTIACVSLVSHIHFAIICVVTYGKSFFIWLQLAMMIGILTLFSELMPYLSRSTTSTLH